MVEVPVKIYMTNLLKKAREAARPMALLSPEAKRKVLLGMADRIAAQTGRILEANKQDITAAGKSLEGETNKDRVKAVVDRVRLTPDGIKRMVERLHRLAELPDPVGEVTWTEQRPNGMQVSRVRAPIGVVGVISEWGPDVMTDSVALCLKAGNVCVYRGGVEWGQTNRELAALWREVAKDASVPEGGVTFVERAEKEAAMEVYRQPKFVDAVVPRGGTGLRTALLEQSRVPVLCHDGGISVMYIDSDTDLPLAQNLVVNSKAQQATASNAVDTVLIHQTTARSLLAALVRRLLDEFKIEVRGCPKTTSLMGAQSFASYQSVKSATEEDWSQQFLSAHVAMKVVADFEEALDHVSRYGPVYTATIITRDYANAMRFTRDVDASAVMINASTRLHEGEEFGLGAQMGVSTGRFHARGPIGLQQLTCEKYVVLGTGQLRHPHPVPVTYEDAIMLKRPS